MVLVVTKFFLETCRLRVPLSNACHSQALVWSAFLVEAHPDIIPLTTGSVAEFYIEPMFPHVGDIDVMWHLSTELAIPQGQPPPRQLPAEFSNFVMVYALVESDLPGYVFLKLRYVLTYTGDELYYCTEYENECWLPNRDYAYEGDTSDIHGPAIVSHFSSFLPFDSVRCLRCLSWPPQAADWPVRQRNFGWPDSATVDRVVNNGCDVVGVAHRQCRQDELMSMHQFRLSFSRAEIVLMNSWVPVQQIVYHLLRVFVKTELSANSGNHHDVSLLTSTPLSNFHIKTLMLWACELKQSSFWTSDINVIRMCVELLHTLSLWLTDARCKHYFISGCNLIDNFLDEEVITRQWKLIDKTRLSVWFLHNYIHKYSQLDPDIISALNDVSTHIKLQNALSEIANWRLNTALLNTWREFYAAELKILGFMKLSVPLCIHLMTELSKTNTCLTVYFTAVTFLQVAFRISSTGLTNELIDVLATAAGQFTSRSRHTSLCSSELSFSKATKLMKLVVSSSQSTLQLIQIELAKAYLYKAMLRCIASDRNSIYCLANVYLAVLYYTTGQYQKAIDH